MWGNRFYRKKYNRTFLKKKKYKIFATYNKRPKFKIKNVKWIKCDLRKPNQVKNIFKDIDVVVQAAATTSGSKDIINKPDIHVTDNTVMNSYIFKYAIVKKVKHIIFFSCTVMLPNKTTSQNEKYLDLNKPVEKKYFGVASTKLFLEKLCEFYSRISNTKFTVIRHSNVYGPHDNFDLEKSHFFGATINKVVNSSKTITIWGDGLETRDLIYIDDLVSFVKKSIVKQKNKFEIFNCGYGKPTKVINVIKKIIFFSKKKLKIKKDLSKPSIKTFVHLDTSKAKRKINWKIKTTLNQGIKKTLDWYSQNEKKTI